MAPCLLSLWGDGCVMLLGYGWFVISSLMTVFFLTPIHQPKGCYTMQAVCPMPVAIKKKKKNP